MSKRLTVWQCRDWCCELKPYNTKWWNVSIAPGDYASVATWRAALRIANTGKLPWSA